MIEGPTTNRYFSQWLFNIIYLKLLDLPMNELSNFLLVFIFFLKFLKIGWQLFSYSHVLFNFLGEDHLDLPVIYPISFHRYVL